MGSKLNSTGERKKKHEGKKTRGDWGGSGSGTGAFPPFSGPIFSLVNFSPAPHHLNAWNRLSPGSSRVRGWRTPKESGGGGGGLPCIFNNLTTHSKQAGDGNKNSIMASWFLPPLFRLTLYSLYRYLIASGIIDLKQTFFWLVTHSSVTGTRDVILTTSAWEVMDIKEEHF